MIILVKKCMIVLLCLMFVTPAFSTNIENNSVDLDSKGKGIDTTVENETTLNNDSNFSNDSSLSNVSEQDIENAIVNNDSIESMDTEGIVMQSTTYSCGPAALATALRNMGINVTEEELIGLSGTDENGTTMFGLIQAAKAKGLIAIGKKLTLNQLQKNYIVFIMVDGSPHYSVIKQITNESVSLADPSLGNININISDFNEAFTGNTIIIKTNDSITTTVSENLYNQTNNDTSISSETVLNANNSEVSSETITNVSLSNDDENNLSNEVMQQIKGKYYQIALTLIAIGNVVVAARNKYLPKKYHKYIAYHPMDKRVKAYIGKDHKIHYKEY